MFNRLFDTAATGHSDEDRDTLSHVFESWRFRRDLAAIMSALDRLSDRRLAMIGMHRDSLFEAVSDMLLEAEQRRMIGREVLDLLERPAAADTDEARRPEPAPETAVPAAA